MSPTPPSSPAPRPPFTNRERAWIALSDLFLDTELTPDDHRRIAEALAPLGFTIDELDRILHHEVYPILSGNLFSVAGVWDGFDEESLVNRIRTTRVPAWRRWRWTQLGRAFFTNDWRAVKMLLPSLLPPP